MKTINYHGRKISVPDWTVSVAIDQDESLYCYSIDAEPLMNEWGSNDLSSHGRYQCHQIFPFESDLLERMDWTETKVVL